MNEFSFYHIVNDHTAEARARLMPEVVEQPVTEVYTETGVTSEAAPKRSRSQKVFEFLLLCSLAVMVAYAGLGIMMLFTLIAS